MPFEPGNQEQRKGHKGKPFRDALRIAVNRAEGGDEKAIQRLADALVAQGLGGDVTALKEIADRLDGKVPQAIGGSDELPPVGFIVTGVKRPDDEGTS